MRKLLAAAVMTFAAASLALAAPDPLEVAPADAAPAEAAAPETEAAETASAQLSEADMNAAPFPPGRHAALVKEVCTECHAARIMLDLRYTREEAENYYINMVDDDLTTEQAQHIIAYLTTTLGVDF